MLAFLIISLLIVSIISWGCILFKGSTFVPANKMLSERFAPKNFHIPSR